jgi:hypothetical protein
MFDVRRSTFDVRRSTFDVRRSTFDVRRSTFDVRRSTFDVRRSTFDVRSARGVPVQLSNRMRPVEQRETESFSDRIMGIIEDGDPEE